MFCVVCHLAELQKALFQWVVLNQNILQWGLYPGFARVHKASGTVETGDTGHLCCSSVREEPLCELSNELKGRFGFRKVSLDAYVMPFCEIHTPVQNAGLQLAL